MKIFNLEKEGICGRKTENLILISVIILSIVFLSSFLIYNQSSLRSLDETRKNIYGEWYTTTYNVQTPIVNTDGLSSIIEQNALICSNNTILGSIGKVDQNFKKLSHIELLSGSLPSNPDEIALTTSLLDALGYSYDLGNIVKIPILPTDFDQELLQTQIIDLTYVEYKLVGILPAYDVFWKKGEIPLVNGVVTSFKENFPTNYQILWKGSKPFDSYQLSLITDTDIVVNEFAYPVDDNFDTSLMIIQIGVIGLAFISNLVVYSLLLNKRKRSFLTMSNLGATKTMIVKIVFVESLLILTFSFIIGIPLSLITGIVISILSKNTMLSIPWIQLGILLLLLYFVCFLSFLISSILIKIDNPEILRNEKTKIINKLSLASKNKLSIIVLTTVIIFVSIGTLYLSQWTMMPYDRNASYAALNIQSAANNFFDEKILNDLQQIPEVKEVAAYNYVGMEYFVTSKEIRDSKVFNDLYESSIEPMPVFFYKRCILSTHFFVLSEKESDLLIELSDMQKYDIERFKNGEGILYYQMPLEKNSTSGMVYDSSVEGVSKGYEYLESPVHTGSMLSLSSNLFVNEEGHDYTVSNVFDNDIEVLGVITHLNDKLLVANNTPITNGSIFISQNFYKKLMLRMEERVVTNDEYTNINVTVEKNSSYSTRKSISSIVTSRGGLLQSDSYEIVDRLYRECSQKNLIVILSGVIIVLFCFVLLWNIVSSSLLIERRRIGILQALGSSKNKLMVAYTNKILIYLIPLIVLINVIIIGIMSIINQPKYLIQFSKIFVYGDDVYFKFPILLQIMLNIVLLILLLLFQLYPLYKMIKNEPINNMKESGGI